MTTTKTVSDIEFINDLVGLGYDLPEKILDLKIETIEGPQNTPIMATCKFYLAKKENKPNIRGPLFLVISRKVNTIYACFDSHRKADRFINGSPDLFVHIIHVE